MVEKEEGSRYWLGEQNVILQLSWVGAADWWVTGWWEEIGVDELSNFEWEAQEGRGIGWC